MKQKTVTRESSHHIMIIGSRYDNIENNPLCPGNGHIREWVRPLGRAPLILDSMEINTL